MSKPIKIMSFNTCEICVNKCKQTDEDLQVCFFFQFIRRTQNLQGFSEKVIDKFKGYGYNIKACSRECWNGRQARLRCVWLCRVGSSPISRTKFRLPPMG